MIIPAITLLVLFVICLGCYTGQTFGNRLFSGHYNGDATVASPVFSCIYGVIIAVITLFLNGLHFAPDGIVWLLGCINGVVVFLYNLGMIQAAHRGPYAFQSIVMLFGGIVGCVLFSVLYWGDALTLRQLIGIAIMLISFVLLNSGDLKFTGIQKGYFFWAISLFISNGVYSVLMDSQQRILPSQRNEMIMITFAVNAVVSLGYLFFLRRGKALAAFASAANGAATLSSGASDLKSGTAQLKAGASSLYDGILQLKNGTPALVDGVTQLKDGAMQLSDGLKQFNEEGIQKIIDLVDGDLEGVIARVRATIDVSKDYQNFSGISDNMDGQVKFIYRTDEIKMK